MEYQPLKYIYHPAPSATHTLLLLHGTGGDETDLLPLAPHFGSQLNVLSVRGNILEQGMPRFFRRISMGVFDEDDLRFRTGELADFISRLAITEHFDPTKVIAVGYSNGANIAGAALLLYPDLLAGAALFRPMQPLQEMPTASMGKDIPVFMSSGQEDATVTAEASLAYAHNLEHIGFQVQHEILPTGHQLTRRDLELAAAWFNEHFPAAG